MPAPKGTEKQTKEERLAAALRANLRRRKAQSRERADQVSDPPDEKDAAVPGDHA